MKALTLEWVAKAEGDYFTARREVKVKLTQIMMAFALVATKLLKST